MNQLQIAALTKNLTLLKLSLESYQHPTQITPLMLAAASNFTNSYDFLSNFEGQKSEISYENTPQNATSLQFAGCYNSKEFAQLLQEEQQLSRMNDLTFDVICGKSRNKYIQAYNSYQMAISLQKAQNTFKIENKTLISNRNQIKQFLQVDSVGRSYLHYLAFKQLNGRQERENGVRLIRIFVQLSVRNLQDSMRLSPLHIAVVSRNLFIIQCVVENTEDFFNLRTESGDTALILATKMNYLEGVQLLVKEAKNQNDLGMCALFYAAINKNSEICEILERFEGRMEVQYEIEIEGRKLVKGMLWKEIYEQDVQSQNYVSNDQNSVVRMKQPSVINIQQQPQQIIEEQIPTISITQPEENIPEILKLTEMNNPELDVQALSNFTKEQDVYESLSSSQKNYKIPYPFSLILDDNIIYQISDQGQIEKKFRKQEQQYLLQLENVIEHYEGKLHKMEILLKNKINDQTDLALVLGDLIDEV